MEALQQENVEPVLEAIDKVTHDGIKDVNGNLRTTEIIITATGFDTSFRLIGPTSLSYRGIGWTGPQRGLER